MKLASRIPRWPRVALVAVLCGSVALTAASGVSAKSATASSDPNTLVIAQQGTINTFDPWSAGSGLNGQMMPLTASYDELLHLSNKGKIIPWLATSWKQVDVHHLQMTLRQGVKFSDGTTFNADAVKANVEYAQTIKTPGQCNSDLKGIVVNVTGPYSVTLHLRQPNPDILLNLATCAGYMVSPQALQDPAKLATTPDGSGPYTYQPSQSVQNQKWVFTKKSNYWAPSAYPFQTFISMAFNNTTAADNAGRSGQVDFIQVVDVTDTSSGMTILKSPPELVRGIALADTKGELVKPLGSKLVRQAMNYAINRPAILKALYKGNGIVNGASSPFTPGMVGYTKALANYYPYDPAKAKALLKQAGYANGFSFPVMDSPTDTNSALTQAIAGYLRKVGINMKITMNATTFIPSMLSGQNPATFAQYTLSGAQYQNMVGLASATAFWNPRHNHIYPFDILLKKLLYSTGQTAVQQWQLFAQRYADEAWWIMPVTLPNASAYNAAKILPHITNRNPAPLLYQFQKVS